MCIACALHVHCMRTTRVVAVHCLCQTRAGQPPRHIDVRHSVGVSLPNRFLSFCYSVHWLTLLAVTLVAFAALSTPLALLMCSLGP